MSTVIGARAPAWLRIVAALGLIWNCFGIYNYLLTVGVVGGRPGASMAGCPPGSPAPSPSRSSAGALGCLGLLLLETLVEAAAGCSRSLAVLAVDLWSFALSGMSAAMGSAETGRDDRGRPRSPCSSSGLPIRRTAKAGCAS